MPKIAVIIGGPANLAFDTASYQYNADRDWISSARLQNIKNYYLPKKFDYNSPLLNPLKESYESYPITLFQAGDYELPLSDTINSFNTLRQASHNIHLQVISELPHVWQLFSKVYAPGRIAIEQAAAFIKKYLVS